jgi:protein-S-isoprenylcysteine O-methyltransferase Ste14
MLKNSFFKWGSASLKGHVVLLNVICAIPLLLVFLVIMRSQGTLTIASFLRMVVVCSVVATVGAVYFWYTFSLPQIKRREKTLLRDPS